MCEPPFLTSSSAIYCIICCGKHGPRYTLFKNLLPLRLVDQNFNILLLVYRYTRIKEFSSLFKTVKIVKAKFVIYIELCI